MDDKKTVEMTKQDAMNAFMNITDEDISKMDYKTKQQFYKKKNQIIKIRQSTNVPYVNKNKKKNKKERKKENECITKE